VFEGALGRNRGDHLDLPPETSVDLLLAHSVKRLLEQKKSRLDIRVHHKAQIIGGIGAEITESADTRTVNQGIEPSPAIAHGMDRSNRIEGQVARNEQYIGTPGTELIRKSLKITGGPGAQGDLQLREGVLSFEEFLDDRPAESLTRSRDKDSELLQEFWRFHASLCYDLHYA
jgi:hypothetical protein